MKINVTKTVRKTTTGSVDAVTALRERAAEAIERAVQRPLRTLKVGATPDDSSYPYTEYAPKPLDLWEAKLCLEIAKLIQETGRKRK